MKYMYLLFGIVCIIITITNQDKTDWHFYSIMTWIFYILYRIEGLHDKEAK